MPSLCSHHGDTMTALSLRWHHLCQHRPHTFFSLSTLLSYSRGSSFLVFKVLNSTETWATAILERP